MIVYKATNLINGKIYIGITIHTLDLRKRQHCCEARLGRNNMIFCKAIKKYGENNFSWEVLFEGENREEIEEKERYYIEHYNSRSRDKGYNMTVGGEGVVGVPLSKEAREKIRLAKMGKNNPMYGKPSPNRGKKYSEEFREKLRKAHKGRKVKNPFSEEHLKKKSLAQQGEKGSNAKLKEEDVLRIRELYSTKKYTQQELSEIYGIARGSVSDIVTRKTWKHI